MNQPTKQQIEEAMAKISIETSHYIGGDMAECDLCGSRGLAEYMDTLAHGDTCPFNVIRTALEFIRSEERLFLMHKKNIDDVAAWRKTEEGRSSIPRTPRR